MTSCENFVILHNSPFLNAPATCIVDPCRKDDIYLPSYPRFLLAPTWSRYVAHMTTQECVIIGQKGSILPCLLNTSTHTARLLSDHQMVTESELGIRNNSYYSPTEVTACLKGGWVFLQNCPQCVLSSVGLLVDCAHLSPGPLKQNAKSSLSHLYQVHATAICGKLLDMPPRGFHGYPISLSLAHRTAPQGKVLPVPTHCSDPL